MRSVSYAIESFVSTLGRSARGIGPRGWQTQELRPAFLPIRKRYLGAAGFFCGTLILTKQLLDPRERLRDEEFGGHEIAQSPVAFEL